MGGLPSGEDPSKFNLGQFGMPGAQAAGLSARTQPNVTEILRQGLQSSSAWGGASQILYDGLNAALSFPLALLSALVERLFPGVDLPDNVTELLQSLTPVPFLGDLAELILGVEDGDLNDLGTFFLGIRNAFFGIDLTNPQSIITAIQAALDHLMATIIQPIIDGIIGAITGAGQIGNDVTAIISTLLNPFQLIQNVVNFFNTITGQVGGQTGGLDARIAALEAAALGANGLVSGDNFNRPTVGSKWTNVQGTLAIEFGDFVRTPAFAAAYYNDGHASTDKCGVSVRLRSKMPGKCRAFMHSDTTMTNYVAVEAFLGIFGEDYVRLVVGNDPDSVVTMKQCNFFGYRLQDGDVLTLKYDPDLNKYFVAWNGSNVPVLEWEDVDNLVTHGSGKREAGVVTCALDQQPYAGFGITDFVYYDWN